MNEQDTPTEKPYPIKQQASMAGGTLVTMALVDAMAHLGPTGLLVGGLASLVAWRHGPELYERVSHRMRGMFSSRPDEGEQEREDQPTYAGKRSLLERAFGVYPQEQAEEDDDEQHTEDEDEDLSLLSDLPKRLVQPSHDNLLPPRRKSAGLFLFSEVLKHFTPTLDRIFLGRLENGTLVFCRAKDLCHVALSGPTRGGKSSIMRMLVAQLCKAGASVLILNPHYSRYIHKDEGEEDEDWTPFEPYLLDDPMECRSYEVIEHYLKAAATELLPKRLDRFAHSQPVGRPYFLALDELPAIIDAIPDAPRYLAKILREGAKVGIYLMVASHDFLVKTISPSSNGGAVRECYRSAFYVGGDATTAKILLDKAVNQFPENKLGRGTIMLRNWIVLQDAALAFVPLVDNAALYRLLGKSTYAPGLDVAEEDVLLSALPKTATQVPQHNQDVPPISQTRSHAHGVGAKSVIERRQARVLRLRGVNVREQAQEQEELKPLPDDLQRAYDAYQNGMSYRDLGNKLDVSKDTAGQAIKRLKDLGYLSEDGKKRV